MRRTVFWILIFVSVSTPVNSAPVDPDVDKACNLIADVSKQIATNRLQGISKGEAVSKVRSKVEKESQVLLLAVVDDVYEPDSAPSPDNVRCQAYDGCLEGFSVKNPDAGLTRQNIVLKCALMYGALFISSRKAGHAGLVTYFQDRLRVIYSEVQSYKGNSDIERDFKRIAHNNKPLIFQKSRSTGSDILHRASAMQGFAPVF